MNKKNIPKKGTGDDLPKNEPILNNSLEQLKILEETAEILQRSNEKLKQNSFELKKLVEAFARPVESIHLPAIEILNFLLEHRN